MTINERSTAAGQFVRRLREEFSLPRVIGEFVIFTITAGGPPWWLSAFLSRPLPWYVIALWILVAFLILAIRLFLVYARSLRNERAKAVEARIEVDRRLEDERAVVGRLAGRIKKLEMETVCQERRVEALCNLQSFCRELVQAPDSAILAGEDQDGFHYLCNNLCDSIAQVFRDGSPGSEKISASLRLSKPDRFGLYPTVGRSSGLSPSRKKHSQPVTAESYVYQELVTGEEGSDRVIRIGSIEEAIDRKRFTRDHNTKHYPHEITSLLISRVNVATKEDGVEQDALWGILYIGSPDRNRFTSRDEMFARVISNLVAATLWRALGKRKINIEEGIANEAQ